MADEPTNGEPGRLIESLRMDMRQDMRQLNGRLDKVVPMDVYAIEKTQITECVSALEAPPPAEPGENEPRAAALDLQRRQYM